MVQRRQKVRVTCQAPGCNDPETGAARVIESRIIRGVPERRTCSQACQLRLWRAEMAEKGFRQVTKNGIVGWEGPDGSFTPMPTQPKKRSHRRRTALRGG